MTKNLRWFWTLGIVFSAVSAFASEKKDEAFSERFATSVKLFDAGQHLSAYNHLAQLKDQVKKQTRDQSNLALVHLHLGRTALALKKHEEAHEHFEAALAAGTKLPDLTTFWLGQAQREEGQNDTAEESWKKVLTMDPSQNLANETLHELGHLAVVREDWKAASEFFNKLERKIRGQPKHPEVLWRLVQVERKGGRKIPACTAARELYYKYPSHPLTFEWGTDLEKNAIEGQPTGCKVVIGDRKRRIRRLQIEGEFERAHNEIKVLLERAKGKDIYEIESVLADHFISEGHVDEALKILLKHYKQQNSNFDFLMLLAKAAARANEFQTAVGAYQRAHQISNRTARGRKALFQAAFLSYQFQDYDGATQKFEQFMQKFPNSGLSRDAQWHLAWLKYLKGDFQGAEEGIAAIEAAKKKKPRDWRPFSLDRLLYWRAMAAFRQEKFKEAREVFESLAADPLYGYYSVASRARLKTMEGPLERRTASEAKKIKVDNAGLPDPSLSASAADSDDTRPEDDTVGDAGSRADGMDSLIVVSGEPTPMDGGVAAPAAPDPKLAGRFERAQQLALLGLREHARWELYEVERRTSNADFRQTLMKEYEKIAVYNRSSYIGTTYFSRALLKGPKGQPEMWRKSYPRAFDSLVSLYGRSYSVPQEFIWGIMRAETFYRRDAVSPVGAMGLMQVMPNTGRQLARLVNLSSFQVSSLLEPETSIRLGSRYLQRLMRLFKNKIPLAAAAYNGGPHRVHGWLNSFGVLEMDEFIEHIPFLETRNYVKKVVSYFRVYQDVYGQNSDDLISLAKPVEVRLTGAAPTREDWDAF